MIEKNTIVFKMEQKKRTVLVSLLKKNLLLFPDMFFAFSASVCSRNGKNGTISPSLSMNQCYI